ncbi:site-specific integrase [Dongia sedimenti]|uniref:Site-specific integrase n=1 Tax=Dongia sedimenti TaxID=3064282 RepID=A0ABU0YTY4_9PROT|nr:site-specific integrase [Rhodospirillaceae bacterium R-7]
MKPGIQIRANSKFRVQVRRNGIYQSKTFGSIRAAEDWQRVVEGKATAEEIVDQKTAKRTTLAKACAWMIGGNHVGLGANAKNTVSKLRYWQESRFANWSLPAIHDWDLIEWRRDVLDEDQAEDGATAGPDALCSPQTVIHRLNTLSKLIQTWGRAHQIVMVNPVSRGVRPSRPDGRTRRLQTGEEYRLINAARKSSRYWLRAAIAISIETCMRQSELGGLNWERVNLSGSYPYADLPKTKNDRPRRVPLSRRAVAALRLLKKQQCWPQNGKVLPVETSRGIIHAFRDAVDEADFPDLRWHDLRHEGISRLFELTDLRDNEIMSITGHLTPAMLTRYTHLRSDRLATRLRGGRHNRHAA